MYDDKEFIGKTLQEIRKRAKMTQSELAERVGISDKHLSKIETGKNLPSLNNFLKMAEVMEFSLDEFGIKSKISENNLKEKLLKAVYSASDKELAAYSKIIVTLDEIIKML